MLSMEKLLSNSPLSCSRTVMALKYERGLRSFPYK